MHTVFAVNTSFLHHPKPQWTTDLSPNDAANQRGSACHSGSQIGLLYRDQFKAQKCNDTENQRNENGILRRMPASQASIGCNICEVARRERNLDAEREFEKATVHGHLQM